MSISGPGKRKVGAEDFEVPMGKRQEVSSSEIDNVVGRTINTPPHL